MVDGQKVARAAARSPIPRSIPGCCGFQTSVPGEDDPKPHIRVAGKSLWTLLLDRPHRHAVVRKFKRCIFRAGPHSTGLRNLRNGERIDVGAQFVRIERRQLLLRRRQFADGHPGGQNSGPLQEPAARNQIKASLRSNINQAGKGTKPFARLKSNIKCNCCRWIAVTSYDQPGGRVKDVRRGVGVLEIKHRVQPPGKRIKGARDALTTQPVVLDKPQNRALVSHRVIDVVLLGVG